MRARSSILAIGAASVLALGNGKGDEVFLLQLVCAVMLLLATPIALFVSATLPGLVERSAANRRRLPLWSFLLGLGDVVALLALAATVGQLKPVGAVLVLLLAAGLVAVGIVGLAGTARSLGARLLALGERPASPLRQLCWGWLLLAGIPLLPILGLLVLLYLLPGAIGAGHLAVHGSGGGRRALDTDGPST